MKTRSLIMIVVISSAVFAPARFAFAQPAGNSTITYQGRLALNGMAVNEDCDVVFSLYDAAAGGNLIAQVGAEATPRVVNIRKGLFTIPLDFGANAFGGGERWVEIAVRPTGAGGPFTVLSPRQSVTPTPYALHALSGGDVSSLDQAYNKGGPGAGRTVNAANGPMSIEGDGGLVVSGNVGVGTPTPNSKLEVAGVVHSTSGGFKFPDGTTQITAALGVDPRASAGCIDNRDGSITNVLCADLEGDIGIKYATGGADDFSFALDVNGSIRSVADVYVTDRLGIGTTTPSDDLTLTTISGPDFLTIGIEVDPTSFGSGTGIIEFRTGPAFTGDDLADITVDYTGTPDAPLDLNSSVTNDVRLAMGGGNVGIGVAPTNRLSVAGDADFTGNVGIGTNTPGSPLEVNGVIHSSTGGIMFPDNTVQTTAATAGGDITEVNTPVGSGLTGGAVTGPVTLNVDFAGTGVATTVARSDHTHDEVGGGDIVVDGSGNVGIGTPTPASKLDVVGDIHATGSVSASAFGSNSPWFADAPLGTPRMRIDDTNGRVSIGSPPTAAPAELLDVDGNVQADQFISLEAVGPPFVVSSSVLVAGLNADLLDGLDSTAFALAAHTHDHGTLTGLADDDHLQYALLAGRAGGQTLNGGTAAGNPLTLNGSTTNDGTVNLNASGGNVVIGGAVAGGNLGIGNPAPFWSIDAIDSQAVARLISLTGAFGSVLELRNDAVAPLNLGAINFNNAVDAVPGQIAYRFDNQMIFSVSSAEAMRIDAAGNVGIGTTTPSQELDVSGDVNVTGTVFADFVSSHSPLQLQTSGTTRVFIDDVSGLVGVNTLTPGQRLDVVGNIQTDLQFISNIPDGTPPLDVDSTTLVNNLNADFLDGRDESEFALLAGRPGGQTLNGGTGANEDLILDSTSDPTKGFVILNPTPVGPLTGSVGIGTLAPTEALEVVGCIKADCIKITSDTVLDISPLSMVRAGSGLELQPSASGTMRIHALATGTQNVMIPINVPNTLFGVQTKLKNVELCYKAGSPLSFITAVRFRLMRDGGTFVNLVDDGTDRKSTIWTCGPGIPVPPLAAPFPDIDGPAFLQLELTIGGTSVSYDLEIGRIKVTLTEGV